MRGRLDSVCRDSWSSFLQISPWKTQHGRQRQPLVSPSPQAPLSFHIVLMLWFLVLFLPSLSTMWWQSRNLLTLWHGSSLSIQRNSLWCFSKQCPSRHALNPSIHPSIYASIYPSIYHKKMHRNEFIRIIVLKIPNQCKPNHILPNHNQHFWLLFGKQRDNRNIASTPK